MRRRSRVHPGNNNACKGDCRLFGDTPRWNFDRNFKQQNSIWKTPNESHLILVAAPTSPAVIKTTAENMTIWKKLQNPPMWEWVTSLSSIFLLDRLHRSLYILPNKVLGILGICGINGICGPTGLLPRISYTLFGKRRFCCAIGVHINAIW
jgi:hypothetical protein